MLRVCKLKITSQVICGRKLLIKSRKRTMFLKSLFKQLETVEMFLKSILTLPFILINAC